MTQCQIPTLGFPGGIGKCINLSFHSAESEEEGQGGDLEPCKVECEYLAGRECTSTLHETGLVSIANHAILKVMDLRKAGI